MQELTKVSLDLRKEIDIDIEVRKRHGRENTQHHDADGDEALPEPADLFGSRDQRENRLGSGRLQRNPDDGHQARRTETAMKRLIIEIEKTKRRVNALEFVLIPRLEEQQKMISFRLDEMERDSFVSLNQSSASSRRRRGRRNPQLLPERLHSIALSRGPPPQIQRPYRTEVVDNV